MRDFIYDALRHVTFHHQFVQGWNNVTALTDFFFQLLGLPD